MAEPVLFERQRQLVGFLTDPEAWEDGDGALARYPALGGMDTGRLVLLGRLSLAKRMEKIEAVLPVTLRHLATDRAEFMLDFARYCPPVSASRFENARDFHRFLEGRWRQAPPVPAWLADLAAFEIAYAGVRFAEGADVAAEIAAETATRVRLGPCCALLDCAWDIRLLFDATVAATEPHRRPVTLAIARPEAADGPRVFEIDASTRAWLDARREWVSLAPAERSTAAALAACGIVELGA